nr:formin-like protein 18 isoform X1 [Equus caballus]
MGLERAGGCFLPSVLPTGRGSLARLPRPGVTDFFPIRWIWRGLSRALKGAAGGRLSPAPGGRPPGTTPPSVQRARSRHARRPCSRRPAAARRPPPPRRCPRAPSLLPPRPSGSRSTGGADRGG